MTRYRRTPEHWRSSGRSNNKSISSCCIGKRFLISRLWLCTPWQPLSTCSPVPPLCVYVSTDGLSLNRFPMFARAMADEEWGRWRRFHERLRRERRCRDASVKLSHTIQDAFSTDMSICGLHTLLSALMRSRTSTSDSRWGSSDVARHTRLESEHWKQRQTQYTSEKMQTHRWMVAHARDTHRESCGDAA